MQGLFFVEQHAMAAETLTWTFGLINAASKYLTAETFQNKVTANGTALKTKQIWTLERVDDERIALKSNAGRYLSSDKDGKISAAAESVGDNEKFEMLTQDDGRVAIRNATHKRYVGGSGDSLTGYDLAISPTNLWTLQLAMHPQINLRNSNRRAYCHLQGNEMQCNALIPWGADAVVTLQFQNGRYALLLSNEKYVSRTGALVDAISDDTLYTLVFRNAEVAFRDCKGKYLTAIGSTATIQSRKDTISKDELFTLENSQPQFQLTASNGKIVSVRGVEEVRANQTTTTDAEIFQLEAVNRTDFSGNVKWAIRGQNKKYWNSEATILANKENFAEPSTQFEIQWLGPLVALKGSNGKYVSTKSNGQLAATSADIADACKFVFEFLNRRSIIFRGEFGFVGPKGASAILECNRSTYEIYDLVGKAGSYSFRGRNGGKFWRVEADNTIALLGDAPLDFHIEFRGHSVMCIVGPNGQYIKAAQNGGFTVTGGNAVSSSTLWEY